MLVFTACEDEKGFLIVQGSSVVTTNNITTNITNNITLAGSNITNNITLANTSFSCANSNEYVWNYSIINGVATGECASDSTGLTSESDPIATPRVNSLNDSLLSLNTTNNIKGLGFNTTVELNSLYYSILNPSNFITDGNTNWDNSYGFITSYLSWGRNDTDIINQSDNLAFNWTTLTSKLLSASGFAGENITSGTVADARIASTLTRDTEVPSLETDSISTPKILYLNATKGGLGSVECTGTDKLMNITLTNTSLSGVCAADQTGGVGGSDGTGGWENSTTNTNTTLHVQVLNNYLNVTNTGQANLWLQGTSAKVTYTETDSDDWTMLLSGGDFFFKQETAASKSFNVRGSDNIDRLKVNLQNSLVVVNNSLQVTGLNSASCDVKAYTNGTLYCGTDVTASSGWTNYTTTEYATTSNTIYVVMTNLTASLEANSRYLITCEFLTYSAAATTGERLQVNLSGTPTTSHWSYNSQVSATTRTSYQGTSASTNDFADTGSAGTNVRDISKLRGYVVTSGSASTLTYAMKSEISASNAAYAIGSFCEYNKVQ